MTLLNKSRKILKSGHFEATSRHRFYSIETYYVTRKVIICRKLAMTANLAILLGFFQVEKT